MTTVEPPLFGDLLRKHRLAANISQEALAERAALSARAISDLERGVRRSPYRDTVRNLARALALDAAHEQALLEAARGARANRSPAGRDGDAGLFDDPLLETKLAVPPPRRSLVPRPRLLARLRQGLEAPLTLLCAPAGSGKTTLLSEWRNTAEAARVPLAWVALDATDNDPAQFWHYLLVALERIAPGTAATAMTLLGPPRSGGAARSRPIESVLTTLVNGLSAHSAPLVLALDDYHLIESATIHTGMTFLLDHLPPCLHLLLISRAEPPLSLARRRARGEIVELRTTDLRFTAGEAAEFLRDVMQLSITAEDAAALEARTEGWIAGLQLAALALQGRPAQTAAAFIEAFSGGNRLVVDYLVDEVFTRQPERLQDFLLKTCILDRLSAGLCASVLGEAGSQGEASSQGLLEQLERGNVFLIALDGERRWYRYHHLFADVLRGRLATGSGTAAAALHRRAGEWLRDHGMRHDAIGHFLAAGAFEPAADEIEQLGIGMILSGTWQTLTTWMEVVPDWLLRSRPRLCLLRAFLMLDGKHTLEQSESYLQEAEAALLAAPTDLDDPNARGEVAALRAMVAALRGDVTATARHAVEAQAHLDLNNDVMRGIASACLGAAYVGQGDFARAEATFVETFMAARAADSLHLAMATTEDLSYVQRIRGRLDEAIQSCRQVLTWCAARDVGTHPFTSALLVSLADLLRERNMLGPALQYLDEAFARSTSWNVLYSEVLSLFVRGRLMAATGQTAAALAVLDQAGEMVERHALGWMIPPVDAFRAQIYLATGKLDQAEEAVLRVRHVRTAPLALLSAQFIIYTHEHVAVAPIQVLLARGRLTADQGSLRAALGLAVEQQRAAESAGAPWLRIKALALQALVRQALGDEHQAESLLRTAIDAAAPGRYLRVFVDEGAPLKGLLSRLIAGSASGAPPYGPAVLAAFD